MPPDGYETVTLPDELLTHLDDHAEAINAESRAEAIRSLFDGYESRVSAHVEAVDNGVVDDIATRTATKTAEELEGRMR